MTTIAFDGICFGDGPVTGVGRSFLNALTAYAASTKHECVLLLPTNAQPVEVDKVRVVHAPTGGMRRQVQLPGLLRSIHADLLHSSVTAVPLQAPCPTVATVHDIPWLHPELGESTSMRRRYATARSLRRANRILAPSTMTFGDIEKLLGGVHPKIELVPHGTTLGEAPTAERVDARKGPLLVLGDDRARKNREALRHAYAIARTRSADLPALELIGPPEHYITEARKHELLTNCRALVHVSRFEGFGMPVLEAMAHGAPVLASTLPPLMEIADKHALFVDPGSVDAIAEGLVRIHEDHELRRKNAIAGHARAAEMQPEHTVAQWHRIHEELLQ